MASWETEMIEQRLRHGHPRFYKLLEEMADLHDRKNHDYSKEEDPLSNLRACKAIGLTPFMGVMVRLQDKWARLITFVKKGQLKVKDESVKDTLMDNAVYSLLGIILLEEEESKSSAEMLAGAIANRRSEETERT